MKIEAEKGIIYDCIRYFVHRVNIDSITDEHTRLDLSLSVNEKYNNEITEDIYDDMNENLSAFFALKNKMSVLTNYMMDRMDKIKTMPQFINAVKTEDFKEFFMKFFFCENSDDINMLKQKIFTIDMSNRAKRSLNYIISNYEKIIDELNELLQRILPHILRLHMNNLDVIYTLKIDNENESAIERKCNYKLNNNTIYCISLLHAYCCTFYRLNTPPDNILILGYSCKTILSPGFDNIDYSYEKIARLLSDRNYMFVINIIKRHMELSHEDLLIKLDHNHKISNERAELMIKELKIENIVKFSKRIGSQYYVLNDSYFNKASLELNKIMEYYKNDI